jgi:hexosaminidase
MSLCLLPQPKELMLIKGTFTFDTDTLICIPAQDGPAAFFAARQIQEEVARATCLTLPIVKAYAPPRPANVILLVCGPEQALAFDVEPVAVDAPEAVAAQAYSLTVKQGRITLYADAPAGLFYAAQTLRQLVRTSRTCRIWPSGTGPPCPIAA